MPKRIQEKSWKMLDLLVSVSPDGTVFIHQETPCETGNERVVIEVSPWQIDALCEWLRQAKIRLIQ